MGLKSYSTIIVGISLLLHSGFSVFESKQLSKQSNISFEIPLDVYIELAIALTIIMVTLVKNILYNDDIGINLYTGDQLEVGRLNFKNVYMNEAVLEDEKFDSGVFDELENSVSFMDITDRRKKFEEWFEKQDLEG